LVANVYLCGIYRLKGRSTLSEPDPSGHKLPLYVGRIVA
jgi:hypothetical protein